jgi:hypothetical protein
LFQARTYLKKRISTGPNPPIHRDIGNDEFSVTDLNCLIESAEGSDIARSEDSSEAEGSKGRIHCEEPKRENPAVIAASL